MVITNKAIRIINVILVILCIFILVKTSAENFLCNVNDIFIINMIFSRLDYGNSEFSSLSASVLAAYVFYFVNIYLPKIKNRREYKLLIAPKLINILVNISDIFRLIDEQCKNCIDFPVKDYSEITEASKQIKVGDAFKGSLKMKINGGKLEFLYLNVEHYLFKKTNDSYECIQKLKLSNTVLDTDLVKILDRIENKLNEAKNVLNFALQPELKGKDFSSIMDEFKGVYEEAEALMVYYKKDIEHLYTGCNSRYDLWFNPCKVIYGNMK